MTAVEEIVVVTGAAGRIGRTVVPLLRRPGRTLRLVDLQRPEAAAGPGEIWHRVDIRDRNGLAEVFHGASGVVHLAGFASERPWADILDVNIDGAQAVLETARTCGVPRVMLASSVHAVGQLRASAADDAREPRPDTFYGVGKAAMEALGSLYADRFGLSVVSARICTFQPQPRDDGRTPALWLSPADAARLVEASLRLDDGRHHVVWGVSANAADWLPLDAGRAIGYHPVDDASAVLPTATVSADQLLGGPFIDDARPVGGTW